VSAPSPEKDVCVCLSFDFDAMSSWIASYRTESPNALSRGEFGKVGANRLLDLLEEHGILSTWFVPGHTIEAFPCEVERIVRAGHEVGHHGYCHEDPRPLERHEEEKVLEMGSALIERATGARPLGYRCPSGSFSQRTLELLVENRFLYDSSMMADDFTPYYCRIGDRAPHDAPYVFGTPVDLLEVPFSWHLDDHPYFEHVRSKRGTNPGLAEPSRVYEVWAGDFDYLYQKMGAGVLTLTMHPQVIGRGSRLLMLEKLIRYMKRFEGVRFVRMLDFATAWRRAHPFAPPQR
jgi:peptidoglycan/xylan/chitin deacetylase (PgdA/CDA1 family)